LLKSQLRSIEAPSFLRGPRINDLQRQHSQKGRLPQASNGTVTTALEYTPRGQLAKESTTYNARRYDVTYTYDAADNIATIQTPSGTVNDETMISKVGPAARGIASRTVIEWRTLSRTSARWFPTIEASLKGSRSHATRLATWRVWRAMA
jgi:hypothetical protein